MHLQVTPTAQLSSRKQLAMEIRDFMARTGIRQTPFGLMAANDDKLLQRIENARYGISLDKADRIRAFMAAYSAAIEDGESTEDAIILAIAASQPAEPADEDVDPIADANHPRDRKQTPSPRRPSKRSVRNTTSSSPCPVEG